MSFAINKNFSDTDCCIDSHMNLNLGKNRSISFIDSFEHHILVKILDNTPAVIKTLASLCQTLDDYPLTQINIEQETLNCILWNDDHSYPIAIDQNHNINKFRQSIREYLHQFLEFAQQILLVSKKNLEINFIIRKSMKYLSVLNDYRVKRQNAFDNLVQNYKFEDALLALTSIDKQQYHELRLIGLYLRQFLLKLIRYIYPKLSTLENQICKDSLLIDHCSFR